ncbi:hypothetical protein TNCV_4046931 [Trichonephila clavipes]|nr:hypothetical protein TNCV_4046931 [Trichonephila clavipes]
MLLKTTAEDRRHLVFFHDEFRGPRSGLCRTGEPRRSGYRRRIRKTCNGSDRFQCHGSLVVMAGMLRVQAKYPPCRGTMHIKSVEFKRPPIGVVVRRGEFQLRCRP